MSVGRVFERAKDVINESSSIQGTGGGSSANDQRGDLTGIVVATG